MKFDIKNRFTDYVQFTAEIDCDENERISIKLRLAVLWAIENGANLSGANFSYANLSGANCSCANLSGAYLRDANCSCADFSGANLSGANFSYANLSGANFSYVNFSYVNFSYANLSGANLSGAYLRDAVGNNRQVKTIQSGKYIITFTAEIMAIGCQQHTIKQWMGFSNKQISAMDEGALEWWKTWKPIIKSIVESNKD